MKHRFTKPSGSVLMPLLKIQLFLYVGILIGAQDRLYMVASHSLAVLLASTSAFRCLLSFYESYSQKQIKGKKVVEVDGTLIGFRLLCKSALTRTPQSGDYSYLYAENASDRKALFSYTLPDDIINALNGSSGTPLGFYNRSSGQLDISGCLLHEWGGFTGEDVGKTYKLLVVLDNNTQVSSFGLDRPAVLLLDNAEYKAFYREKLNVAFMWFIFKSALILVLSTCWVLGFWDWLK